MVHFMFLRREVTNLLPIATWNTSGRWWNGRACSEYAASESMSASLGDYALFKN